MSTLVIETIGYTAAVVTNISVYPQAYEVYVIVQTRQYTKLKDTFNYNIFFTNNRLFFLAIICFNTTDNTSYIWIYYVHNSFYIYTVQSSLF